MFYTFIILDIGFMSNTIYSGTICYFRHTVYFIIINDLLRIITPVLYSIQ